MHGCTRCLEAGHDIAVPPATHLGGASPVMVVGVAPGATEAALGKPFQGPSGRRLDQWFTRAGFPDWREVFFTTSLTKCYPGKNPKGKGDRTPSPAELDLCTPWLEAQITLVQPRVILPLGKLPLRRFLGRDRPLHEVVGQAFPQDGRLILPLPHPSPGSLWLNDPENQARLDAALGRLAREARAHGLAPAGGA